MFHLFLDFRIPNFETILEIRYFRRSSTSRHIDDDSPHVGRHYQDLTAEAYGHIQAMEDIISESSKERGKIKAALKPKKSTAKGRNFIPSESNYSFFG